MFTWIPKNAGRSIFAALERHHGAHKGVGIYVPYSHLLAINPEIGEFFHFAIIRNPWDRLVSCYFNKIFVETPTSKRLVERFPGLASGMPFEAFIEWLASEAGNDDAADQHWASQHLFLRDNDGNQFVNHLVRYESLREELAALSERVGLNSKKLPHRNSREKLQQLDSNYQYDPDPFHYRKHYTNDRMIDQVAQRYKIDIDLFGYSF